MSSVRKHTGGRTKHPAWDETYEVRVLGEKVSRCKYCRKDVGKKIERVLKHLEKCEKKAQHVAQPGDDDDGNEEDDDVMEMEASCTQGSSSSNTGLPALESSSVNVPLSVAPSTSSTSSRPTSQRSDNQKPSKMRKLDTFVVTTDASTKMKLDSQVAKAFYSCRIPFNAIENDEFRKLIEMLRPGYNPPSRKDLSGFLLDKEYKCYEDKMKSSLSDSLVTISQDGWSNVRSDPIVATGAHTDGKCFPLDQTDVGSTTKSAEYLFELAKKSIEDAENNYGADVVGFVSDNENKMLMLRGLLQSWRPSLVAVGCSAHYLNSILSKATPREILEQIIAIQKAFRSVHKLHGMLKEKGGLQPQLPVETRWQSHEAVLHTFVKNYSTYLSILEELEEKNEVPKQLPKRSLESRFVYNEAKHMLLQLRKLTEVLDRFQAETTSLSDCLSAWMEIEQDDNLSDVIRTAVTEQMKKAITPWHVIAYLADFTKESKLPVFLEESGKQHLINLNPQYGAALVCFELRDKDSFPSSMMNPALMKQLGPKRFWRQINTYGDRLMKIPKGFGRLMEALQTIPCSSAGLERIFSSYSIIHTKLRNRLTNQRVEKLVKVYHTYDKKDDVESIGLDLDLDDSSNS